MIQCAPIFTDHMVLQQEKNTAVFGTGSPGETVTVSVPERKLSASTVVQPSGMWQVQLLPERPVPSGSTILYFRMWYSEKCGWPAASPTWNLC